MARKKTKVNLKKFREKYKKFTNDALKAIGKEYKIQILESIARGTSPVQGEGRFDKYSESYRKAIKSGRYKGKKVSPVNLKLTGKLLKSYKSKIQKSKRNVLIRFDNSLANIHTILGAGRSKTIRKMLPQDDERFNAKIRRTIREVVSSISKKIFK